jgi:general secretion pathway protein A
MEQRKLQALYGLKWNPFSRDLPIEALQKRPEIEHFCWRVENLVMDGGFAMIQGDPGLGKSAALRQVSERMAGIREVTVGEFSRPQSSVADFYREMGSLFQVEVRSSNRFGGHKALRAKWRAHIESSLLRPVLAFDEAQEMNHQVLTELRLLSSENYDTKVLLTVILAGDGRLREKLTTPQLMPVYSRMRTKLILAPYSRDELIVLLTQALGLAGNPLLMTEDLIGTLAEHAGGNPRSMMQTADDLLYEAVRQELKQLDTKLYLEFFSRKGVTFPTKEECPPDRRAGLTRRIEGGAQSERRSRQ